MAGVSTARAQGSTASDSLGSVVAPDNGTAIHVPVRSSIDQPAAVRRTATADASLAASPERKNLGQPRALMIVGAAAFVAGAIIEGDAGRILMVSGAVVGIYGLYEYLK